MLYEVITFLVGDHETELEIFQDLFNELYAGEVGVFFGKIMEGAFMQEPFEQWPENNAGDALLSYNFV